MTYSIRIPYKEFRYNFVETDDSGPWGDDYFQSVFDKYVEDDMIEIDYRQGPCVDWKTESIWKVSGDDTKKARRIRYGHSSPFAHWWCNLTDEMEEELTCPNCKMVNGPVEFKTTINNGDEMVCEDCYNNIEKNN